MAQRTFTINIDALVALVGSTSLGAGKDQHLPIGLHGGGYLLRSLAKFNLDFSGVVSINYARLYLRCSSYHISPGGSAGLQVKRITSSWSEGTRGADEVWYGDNAVEWSNQPSFTSTGAATDTSFGRTANVWEYIDITSIVDAWRTGSTNYGVLLQAISEGSTAYATGFYSRESSYDPYILIDYETNTAPNAPTLNSPANASIVGDTTPDFKFTLTDPESDTMTKYQIQIDNNSGFGSPEVDDTVNGSFASGVQQTYTPSALNRGTLYYWRVRAYDGSLWGNWSSVRYVTINSLPTATLTDPAATGRLAHMVFTPGSGWSTPRVQIAWDYSDAQGQTQTKYELEIDTDSGGSPSGAPFVSGEVSSSASTVTPSATYTEGDYYHVRVRVFDGLEWSSWSGWFRVRARWGSAVYAEDARIGGTVTPTGYSLQSLTTTTPTNSKVEVEYNSGTDAVGSGLGTWQSTLATVSPQDFVYYRVWLFFWGASPATSPSLDEITIRSTGNVAQPDYWLPSPLSSVGATIELDDKVFGTQSLKIAGNSTTRAVEQQVVLEPNRDYVLQGRVRSIGNSGAHIELRDAQGGTTLLSTASHTADSDWTQDTSAVWNSESRTVVWIAVVVTGAGGTAGLFDGLKMERGVVASPWNPGLVGSATVVDAGGLAVDASAGGIFRLRGAAGGDRDVISLGDHGFVFGGDTIIDSPAAGIIRLPNSNTVGLADGTGILQVGPSGGGNMGIGTGRIQARDGASGAAQLNLNREGGLVTVNDNAGSSGLKITNGPLLIGSDVVLQRQAANILETGSGDSFDALGGLLINGNKIGYWVQDGSAGSGPTQVSSGYANQTITWSSLPANKVLLALVSVTAKSSTLTGLPGIYWDDYSGTSSANRQYAQVAGGWFSLTGMVVMAGTNRRQCLLRFFNTGGSPTWDFVSYICHGYFREA